MFFPHIILIILISAACIRLLSAFFIAQHSSEWFNTVLRTRICTHPKSFIPRKDRWW